MKNLNTMLLTAAFSISFVSFAQAEDEVLMVSKRWSVTKSVSEGTFQRESCQAQTINAGMKNHEDAEVILKVMNLRNSVSEQYNEPMVMLTVESLESDLSEMVTMSIRISGDRVDHEMNLISSLSNANKRVFILKIEDRASVIDKFAKKNTVSAKFFKGVNLIDSTVLSLSGSFKAIKGTSIKDASLSNKCGGTDLLAGL